MGDYVVAHYSFGTQDAALNDATDVLEGYLPRSFKPEHLLCCLLFLTPRYGAVIRHYFTGTARSPAAPTRKI